jgi:translocation and assembly module TamB
LTSQQLRLLSRIAVWAGGFAAGLTLMLALLLWTPPGHRAIEWIVWKATDGEVKITELGGALPGSLHAHQIELHDAGGIWLRVTDVELAWSPFPALNNHYVIHRVAAAKVELLRRPLPSETSSGATLRIDVESLSLPRIDIAPALIGHAASLAAQGSLHFVSLRAWAADLAISRPGSSDHYTLNGAVMDGVVKGTAAIAEAREGLLGKIVGLPGLGPVALSARASGDRAANAVAFRLTAGRLSAGGQGTISLAKDRADIDFSASSPSMQLNDQIGWARLAAEGHLHGVFDAPQIDADFHLAQLRAAGSVIAAVDARAQGRSGIVDLTIKASGLSLPGNLAGLFAGAPVEAAIQANLKDAVQPVHFAIRHKLANLEGTAHMAGAQNVVLTLSVPSLAPFAAVAGADVKGGATLKAMLARQGDQVTLDLTGGIHADGKSTVARMLGRNAALSLNAVIAGSDVLQSRLAFRGAGFDTKVDGSFRGGRMAYRIDSGLTDLSRLAATLTGTARLAGTITGVPAEAEIALSGEADMASNGFARQSIALKIAATGLPNPVSARITGKGKFDDAGFALAADWSGSGGGHNAKLSLDWKSLTVRAAFTVPRKGASDGQIAADARNLGDLSSLVGMTMAGRLHVTGNLEGRNGKQQARLHLNAAALRIGPAALDRIQADGTLADALGASRLDAKLNAQGLSGAGITGALSARLDGPLDKLAATVNADLKDSESQPVHVAADAQVNMSKAQLRLEHLRADWRGQTATLVRPATFDLAGGVAIDALALKEAGGSLRAAGRLSPKLALTARAENIQLSAFEAFLPLPVEGRIDAQADLSGSLAAPTGTIALDGKDLRIGSGSGKLAPSSLQARTTLHGETAQLTAKLSQTGAGALTVEGTAPLSAAGALDLHAAGNADLALFNPLLVANGRQINGHATLNLAVTGTFAAPRLAGSATLQETEFQDYTQGLRIRDIAADLKAEGEVIHIARFEGRAGPGTVSGSGQIDFAGPGWPVDLAITARNARPIVSDMMTASLSGDLKLTGTFRKAVMLSGKLDVPHAEINIPDSFPPEVRTLNIRHSGEKPPPPAAVTALGLDLAVVSTGPVIVRGRGIDADLAGSLQLSGSSGAPRVGGGFKMRRGTLTVAGQTLNFTRGTVTFNGGAVQNRLDPVLDLVAETTSGGVTATLTVSGYASAPKITLSSSPQLPQDEVLAHLLFQQSAKQLTPLQLAQMAQALASLSGVGNGFDPVASVRGSLGLDRLAVSGGSGATTDATVEAGKYVSHNIYVGAKQSASGNSQAQVQLDITRNLKAQATVTTGTNATATQGTSARETGGSVGLSYQFEY